MTTETIQMDDIRLICAKCGACAGHPEDRDGQRCRHCGERETVVQKRDANGAWVDALVE
jgi:DNA-directed RNA polymerase subunit RPC12/RpoP